MTDAATPESAALGPESWPRVKVGEPMHLKLAAHGKNLRTMLKREAQYDRTCELIYENPKLREFGLAIQALRGAGFATKKLNVAKSVIDSYCARVGKGRAMPAFEVNDADWDLQLQAKDARKWLIGKMTETEFDRLSREALKDSAITRAGLTKITDGDDDIVAERIYSHELLVDPREGMYGKPRQIIQVHRISRQLLLDKYQKNATLVTAIKTASPATRMEWETDESGRTLDLAGYVDVWEGWYLPTDEDDETGRRGLCLDTGTLASERWYVPRFPISVCRYDKARRGFWGVSLLSSIADIQHNINNLVRDIQHNVEVAGKLIMAVNEINDIPVETMTGANAFKLKYKGPTEPKIFVPNAINPAHVSWLEFWMKQAYDLPGVSQAMASSRSSLGLNASGVALDTQYDIDSERFSDQVMGYANYRLDGAQNYLDAAQAIVRRREADKGKKRSFVAMYSYGGTREELDWLDVKLPEKSYKLQLEPVNFIPDTRAGKLSAIQELLKAGVLPQWMAGALFDEPDLARANSVAFADFHNLERIMDGLNKPKVDLGTLMPETYHNLSLALIFGRAYYNRAQAKKAPETVQERFRTWINAVIDEQKKQKAKEAADALASMPPAGGAPMQGGPPGAGGPGLPPGMGPPNGMPVAPIIAPPMAA